MAKHEFGIMPREPKSGERYDEYEPEKYNCICVDDEDFEPIVANFKNIDFYWHTIDVKGKGLEYSGITLIPPCSIKTFIDVIKNISALSKLKKLSEKALNENKWIIHFGV